MRNLPAEGFDNRGESKCCLFLGKKVLWVSVEIKQETICHFDFSL